MTPVVAHLIALLVGVIAYVVLTLTGHSGNDVLVAAVGYGGGATVAKVAG